MPFIIEGVQSVDDAKPRVVRISVSFPNGPRFAPSTHASQLIQERGAVAMLGRKLRVTHLMDQDAALGAR